MTKEELLTFQRKIANPDWKWTHDRRDHIIITAREVQIISELITLWIAIGQKTMSPHLRIDTDPDFNKPQHGQESGIHSLEGTVGREFLAERQSTPDAMREALAKIVYDAFPFDYDPYHKEKPPWNPGGNSIRQDDARNVVDKILTLSSIPVPSSNGAEPKTLFYTILSKYIPQESLDQAWQEIKEAGIFR